MIKEYSGENCSWCVNEDGCNYNRPAMEKTREVIRNISGCTKAFCSCKVTCDYYVKDASKYAKYNMGENRG